MGIANRQAAETRDVVLEMNTTPLIDVLLKLLVMLIITIPLQTHAVKLDLPSGVPLVVVDRIKNVLTISSEGATGWNGQAVNDRQLRAVLAQSVALPSQPELHIAPASRAPYGAVDHVLVMTKQAHVVRIGFVGNEAYRDF